MGSRFLLIVWFCVPIQALAQTKPAASIPPLPAEVELVAGPLTANPPTPDDEGWAINGQTGFVIRRDAIFKTDDGGRKWQQLAPRDGIATVFGEVHAIRIDPSLRGWLASKSGVWKTTDGGTRWTRIFGGWGLPWFYDQNHGWMLVNRTAPGAVPFNNVTNDGGLTWRQCNDDPPPIRHGYIFDVRFVSPTTAFAMGADDSAHPIQVYVIRTDDGGCTWAKSPELQQQLGEAPHTLFFLDEKNAWIGGEGRIYRTEDSGAHWTPIPLEGEIRSIFFENPMHGWLLAFDGGMKAQMRESTDAGKSWLPLPADKPIHLPEAWEEGRVALFSLH